MITPAVAAELLAARCPSFATSPWSGAVADVDDAETAAHLRLSLLALHACDLERDGRGDDVAPVFDEVERLLAAAPAGTRDAIAVAFVEALLCACSHAEGQTGRQAFVGRLGSLTWQRWHQGHERAEALSTARRVNGDGHVLLASTDPWVRALARATTFRAENGRLVSLAERGGMEAPARAPILGRPAVWAGGLFALVLLLALSRIVG